MAKLKCRCGHKFAETLADLQQQGVSRLKCPACGQVSTIPAGGNVTEPVSNQTESVGVSSSSDVGDFFSMLSNESTPIPLTVTATPEAEPVELPTTRPDVATGSSWPYRAGALLRKKVAVPIWLMLSVGVGVLSLVIALRGSASVAEQKPDDYQVTGVDLRAEPGAAFHISAIKEQIRYQADDPKSIQWVRFLRITEEDNPSVIQNQLWIVRYRALNTHKAMELFQEGVEFEVNEETRKASFFKIKTIRRLPVDR